MPQPDIVAVTSMREFFQQAVHAALEHHPYQPHEATASYLVDLLCNHTKSSKVDLNQALALLMAQSQQALPSESIGALKKVGDQSLYVSGFFSDSIRRSKLDPDYYVVLGGTAYQRLSGVLQRHGDTKLVIVYTELAHEFPRFVQVLSDIKHQGDLVPDAEELDQLYEEWLRTGSPQAARRLQAAGLVILKGPATKQ